MLSSKERDELYQLAAMPVLLKVSIGFESDPEPQSAHGFNGSDIRTLYFWLEQARRSDDNSVVRDLQRAVLDAYTEMAKQAGRRAALLLDEVDEDLSPHAHPVWRDAYKVGWAEMKSEIAEREET